MFWHERVMLSYTTALSKETTRDPYKKVLAILQLFIPTATGK